jgi:hypothetical protein
MMKRQISCVSAAQTSIVCFAQKPYIDIKFFFAARLGVLSEQNSAA